MRQLVRRFWRHGAVAVLLALGALGGWGLRGRAQPQQIEPIGARTAPLQVRVIDARDGTPLAGAEVVTAETGQRLTTGPDGRTPEVQAPIIRDPRFPELIAELHGQLTLIAYKNGYRDTVYLGVQVEEGLKTETEIWMYKITPEDTRIEPVAYHVPVHRLWILEAAERFRSTTQPGEGPESPER